MEGSTHPAASIASSPFPGHLLLSTFQMNVHMLKV